MILMIILFCSIETVKHFSKSSRTIMIYLVGTDLETKGGLASRDLQDLKYEKIKNNNVNVVLIAGGTKTWKNNYIDSTSTSIYELKETGFVKVDNRKITNIKLIQ